LACVQLFLHLWNFGFSVRLAGSVRDTHTENDLTFWSVRMSERSGAAILSADITSWLGGPARETIWNQNNQSRARGLFSSSVVPVFRSSFFVFHWWWWSDNLSALRTSFVLEFFHDGWWCSQGQFVSCCVQPSPVASKSYTATIFSIDITSWLAGSVRESIWNQNNHRRGRGLCSLSVSRVLRTSFVLVVSPMMMIG
jgi:hypothetical protein